jgi:hypothetical protein
MEEETGFSVCISDFIYRGLEIDKNCPVQKSSLPSSLFIGMINSYGIGYGV